MAGCTATAVKSEFSIYTVTEFEEVYREDSNGRETIIVRFTLPDNGMPMTKHVDRFTFDLDENESSYVEVQKWIGGRYTVILHRSKSVAQDCMRLIGDGAFYPS